MSASVSVTVTTAATQLAAANVDRQSLFIHNAGGTTVFLNDSSSATIANGLSLLPSTTFAEDNSGSKVYTGPIFGIVAAGTEDVRVWERTITN